MPLHELAGKPAPAALLVNVPRLVSAYYTRHPDVEDPAQRVAFGTSGHRGSSLAGSFNEDHILAISQAICEYRLAQGITGPLFIGMDTHALSEPALITAVEVFAANGVEVTIQADHGYTPTPVISHAILTHNRGRVAGLADGVVITPSHNPPEDGGFKYNPPSGGPADTGTTRVIQDRANQLLAEGLGAVKRVPYEKALRAETAHLYDYVMPYVRDLRHVVDLEKIAAAGLKIGVDPMGGAGIAFWDPIAETYGLDLTVVNPRVDPTFSFMTVDRDGVIRMDCSSPYAMARLIGLKDKFDIAFGNDPDYDRHGIVTRGVGLMQPNHYLAVAIWYLFQHRSGWGPDAAVGKTLVSSAMIDRVAESLGRRLVEVPVGFKWFVDGLLDGSCGFGGEESAGASFLRQDGTVWTTDKDGIIMDLLAAEIMAVTDRDPAEHYADLEGLFGSSVYQRLDAPATAAQKAVLAALSPEMVTAKELAGEPIIAKLTRAPGNDAAIGGLKVVTEDGWFAARPSGTEEIYKIYAESFRGADHLKAIQEEAQAIVTAAFHAAEHGSGKPSAMPNQPANGGAKMSGIVCAIRGGPPSQPTILEAINLARETGLPIYFLYVVNIDFLTRTSHTRVQTILEELRDMGEFILLSAQTTAEAQGVTAHGVVREGNVREEIIALCREVGANYAILGRPQAQSDQDVFTHDLLGKFAQQIEADTGAKVVFPSGDAT